MPSTSQRDAVTTIAPFLWIGHLNNLFAILRKEFFFFKYFNMAFAILPSIVGGLA
jgi:hypothetical protein